MKKAKRGMDWAGTVGISTVRLGAGAAVAATVLLLTPDLALACPTCFAGVGDRESYFITFVFLTVLPLAFMGAVIYWLVRRVRQAERAEAERSGQQPQPDPRLP